MPTGLGNSHAAKRAEDAPGRLPLTLHSIQAAGLAHSSGSTSISQPHVRSRCKAGHCMSAKVETTSSRNLVQHVDS